VVATFSKFNLISDAKTIVLAAIGAVDNKINA